METSPHLRRHLVLLLPTAAVDTRAAAPQDFKSSLARSPWPSACVFPGRRCYHPSLVVHCPSSPLESPPSAIPSLAEHWLSPQLTLPNRGLHKLATTPRHAPVEAATIPLPPCHTPQEILKLTALPISHYHVTFTSIVTNNGGEERRFLLEMILCRPFATFFFF